MTLLRILWRLRMLWRLSVMNGSLLFLLTILTPVVVSDVVTGRIVDADTGRPMAARVYLQDDIGKYHHVQSVGGTAISYAVRRSDTCMEVHTTISAHPFQFDLPPGRYKITVESGKEYLPYSHTFQIESGVPRQLSVRLERWIHMAQRGWFSGETHVHRRVDELPTLQLAEDVNVAFPLTAWVTDSAHIPATHNKNDRSVPTAKLVQIDKTHVYWPVNTEYEIFTVRGRRHTLGAVFVLNHRDALTLSAPPVVPIAQEARRQGGFLELDKHNWPWSMMLVPQMNVELFELANNHMWRTEFLFKDWYPEYVGDYMDVEVVDGRFTERGWIDFGFENYYALLNCGFKMKPTAGSASGVHPVPFGFGRVYVHVDGGFSYEKWKSGLLEGRSFVTTGPMLFVDAKRTDKTRILVSGALESATKAQSIEVIVNGRVVKRIEGTTNGEDAQSSSSVPFRIPLEVELETSGTTWVAVRAFADGGDGRVRFAHTAPHYFEDAERPLRPTTAQRDYLAGRVRDELNRSRRMLSAESITEFEHALRAFQSIPTE